MGPLPEGSGNEAGQRHTEPVSPLQWGRFPKEAEIHQLDPGCRRTSRHLQWGRFPKEAEI